ncbi:hypothetical protein BOX15_Mlig013958g3, partial [Macrostomum lignano]
QMKRKLSKKRGKCHQQFDIFEHSFNRKAMATKTVTATRVNSLVLHFSIPVAEERCSRREEDPVATATDDSRFDLSSGRHNVATTATASSSTAQPGFEGDNISPAYFRRMAPAPAMARRRLLLAVEPRRMAPRRQWVRVGGTRSADLPAPVVSDFCVPFDRDLLKKLRANRAALQSIADRTCSLLYIRKTLLLRGTHRTKTWAKYFMCRFYSLKQPLLKRCFRLLEQFDAAFCTRHRCQHERDRVTLLLNRSVPENTSLRVSRQRLRKSDDYFGKMPLLPDPHLASMAARLTRSCVSSSSLLAQLVAWEP